MTNLKKAKTTDDMYSTKLDPYILIEMNQLYKATRLVSFYGPNKLKLDKILVDSCIHPDNNTRIRVYHNNADTGEYHGYRVYYLCVKCLGRKYSLM